MSLKTIFIKSLKLCWKTFVPIVFIFPGKTICEILIKFSAVRFIYSISMFGQWDTLIQVIVDVSIASSSLITPAAL